ncbi:MAG: hypothetical protein ABIN96_03080 [Rubrivivax sp.]
MPLFDNAPRLVNGPATLISPLLIVVEFGSSRVRPSSTAVPELLNKPPLSTVKLPFASDALVKSRKLKKLPLVVTDPVLCRTPSFSK